MGYKEKMLNGDSSDMIETAVSICRGYLNGPWKRITSEDVTVKKLSGGLSNWLYQVRLEKGASSPKQVLLRLYGQTHGEDALEALVTESVIFTLLSERRLGPRLYGVFPGGRIEEYLPARPLKQEEMSEPQMSLMVAEKMAAVHTMHVPINKEPRWLWQTIHKWLANIDNIVIDEGNIVGKRIPVNQLRGEVDWLREHLGKVYSPAVFCHNDLQQGNILVREDDVDRSIVLIDFEYCSYNYRGFDLANHLVEWTYDYTLPQYPHFSVNKANYPSHHQMASYPPHAFVEKYLEVYQRSGGKLKPGMGAPSVVREVRHYTLASHLFWALWSIVNATYSKIPFGYWEYAEERLGSYFQLKSEILAKQNSWKEPQAVKRKMTDLEE